MTTKSFLLGCSIAAALVTATPVRAENLIEVYLDAVRGDPMVREAEARRDAALEAKPQARGALLPQVNVNGQYATRDTDGENVFNQLFDPDNNPATDNSVIVPVRSTQASDSDFWNYQAEITQSLFSWEQWQALKRADSSVAVAEATYRAAQQNLLVRVSQAYFDVLAAEDTLGAAEATLEALTRQLEQADKRFEVGLIAITDVHGARRLQSGSCVGLGEFHSRGAGAGASRCARGVDCACGPGGSDSRRPAATRRTLGAATRPYRRRAVRRHDRRSRHLPCRSVPGVG